MTSTPRTPGRSSAPRARLGARFAGAAALALLLGAAGCGGEGGSGAVGAGAPAAAQKVAVPGLSFAVPQAWKAQKAQTNMRLAEYTVPGSGGEASLVLYRFANGGGSAQANVERWVGQFTNAQGGPPTDTAAVKQEQRDGLTLTTLDVSGNYAGQQMPGAPAQPSIQGARLLALVVEGSGPPYFFKLLGPAATVTESIDAWNALSASVVKAD
jgi:hypothetical protein